MPKENEEATIKQLQEENKALKKHLANIEEELEDLELALIEVEHEDASWTDTLTQDEIDSIVCSKIAQEMVTFLDSYSNVAEMDVIEMVTDVVYKKAEVEGMSADFKSILSLGLRTKMVLADAFYLFLKVNRNDSLSAQDFGY